GQAREVTASREASPPDEGDRPPGNGLPEGAVADQLSEVVLPREVRDQGVSGAGRHHVAEGLEARGLEAGGAKVPVVRTDVEDLVSQAMAVLEEDHGVGPKVSGGDVLLAGERVPGRQGEHEGLVEQGLDGEGCVVDGQGGQHGVESARLEGVEEIVGQPLPEVKLQAREAMLQRYEEMGHEEGLLCGDPSQTEV